VTRLIGTLPNEEYMLTPQGSRMVTYRGADKSLTPPGRKQATATEDFDFDISYL
jgi:hypothetical protein